MDSFEKTPVSVLNELMAKLGIIPIYELIASNDNILGTKTFEVKVTCDKVTAAGSGKSKKEAKHFAAKAMLAKVKKDKVVAKPDVESLTPTSSLDNVSFNYVQELKKITQECKLEEPIYKDIESIGPHHSLTHIVHCFLSDLKLEGRGKSKKDARQDAAQKMIKEVQSNFCSNKNNSVENKHNKSFKSNTKASVAVEESSSNNSLKEREVSVLTVNKEDMKLRLSSYGVVSNLKNLDKLIKECHLKISTEKIAKINEEFQVLMDRSHIDFNFMLLQSQEPVTYQLTIQLDTVPDILETSLGKTSEEVHLRTIEKILKSLKKMISH